MVILPDNFHLVHRIWINENYIFMKKKMMTAIIMAKNRHFICLTEINFLNGKKILITTQSLFYLDDQPREEKNDSHFSMNQSIIHPFDFDE